MYEKRWRRWSGTPAHIVLLARRAEKLMAAAKVENPRVRITVKHRDGENRYQSAEDAAAHIDAVDLRTVTTVHLAAGQLGGLSIIVNFFRNGPYLAVEGQGDHRLVVAGIASAMSVELDRQDRSYPHERAFWAVSLVTGWLLLGGSFGAQAADLPRGIALAAGVLAAIFTGFSVWVLLIRPIFVPGFEIHGAEQQSRAAKWGGKIRRFASWAFTLVLGALIGVLIQRWLE